MLSRVKIPARVIILGLLCLFVGGTTLMTAGLVLVAFGAIEYLYGPQLAKQFGIGREP